MTCPYCKKETPFDPLISWIQNTAVVPAMPIPSSGRLHNNAPARLADAAALALLAALDRLGLDNGGDG